MKLKIPAIYVPQKLLKTTPFPHYTKNYGNLSYDKICSGQIQLIIQYLNLTLSNSSLTHRLRGVINVKAGKAAADYAHPMALPHLKTFRDYAPE